MALLLDIEDLLAKRKVESNRIEFKKGWNPAAVYRSICAFANDFDNLGGGYILIGVAEEKGKAVRPVCGVPDTEIDTILKKILQYNRLIEPYYMPRVSVEDVDGKNVIAIWVPSGENRPYVVPSDVTAKHRDHCPYIRYGTSSIEAEGETLDELRGMASKVPFDDRGNPEISFSDLSPVLIKEHLQEVGSKLADEDLVSGLPLVLEQMNLMEGPTEKRMIKNVAAMMFCNHPDRFFPVSQVRIASFPNGRDEDPDNIVEYPTIIGSVPNMIRETLQFLRTNIVKEKVVKIPTDEKARRFFNYPYAALEEAVVNALYHRDYSVREPVEITIEPRRISILNFPGPNRSISEEAIKEGRSLRSRRYRNRRLGEFLKQLGLAEGWATGIPTIQRKLEENGSPKATIETDETRSYFLIDIPCHPDFLPQDVSQDNDFDLEKISVTLSQVVSQEEQNRIQLMMDTYCLLQRPMSLKELMISLGQTNRGRYKRMCIDVMISIGLVGMTHPDVPNSKKQKYFAVKI